MTAHEHRFVETYDGPLAFGMDRLTDERTVICYLQKFSDDHVMQKIIPQMADTELDEVFTLISRLLKKYLSEAEYHRLFLKDDHP